MNESYLCCNCGKGANATIKPHNFSNNNHLIHVCSQKCAGELHQDNQFIQAALIPKSSKAPRRTIRTYRPQTRVMRDRLQEMRRRLRYKRLARNRGFIVTFGNEPPPRTASGPACVEIDCPPQFPADATCWRCINSTLQSNNAIGNKINHAKDDHVSPSEKDVKPKYIRRLKF